MWQEEKKRTIPQSFRSSFKGQEDGAFNGLMRLDYNLSGNNYFYQICNFYCHINSIHRDASSFLQIIWNDLFWETLRLLWAKDILQNEYIN